MFLLLFRFVCVCLASVLLLIVWLLFLLCGCVECVFLFVCAFGRCLFCYVLCVCVCVCLVPLAVCVLFRVCVCVLVCCCCLRYILSVLCNCFVCVLLCLVFGVVSLYCLLCLVLLVLFFVCTHVALIPFCCLDVFVVCVVFVSVVFYLRFGMLLFCACVLLLFDGWGLGSVCSLFSCVHVVLFRYVVVSCVCVILSLLFVFV